MSNDKNHLNFVCKDSTQNSNSFQRNISEFCLQTRRIPVNVREWIRSIVQQNKLKILWFPKSNISLRQPESLTQNIKNYFDFVLIFLFKIVPKSARLYFGDPNMMSFHHFISITKLNSYVTSRSSQNIEISVALPKFTQIQIPSRYKTVTQCVNATFLQVHWTECLLFTCVFESKFMQIWNVNCTEMGTRVFEMSHRLRNYKKNVSYRWGINIPRFMHSSVNFSTSLHFGHLKK